MTPLSAPLAPLARRFATFTLALVGALLLSCALPSCGPSEEPVEEQPPVAAPTDPDVIMIVNGIEVRRPELERSIEFHELVYPDRPEVARLSMAINDDVITMAGIRSYYAELITAKRAAISQVLKSIRGGETFQRAGRVFTASDNDFHRVIESWKYPRELRFSSQGLPTIRTKKGEYHPEPIVTFAGVHLLYVDDRIAQGELHEQKTHTIEVVNRFEPPSQSVVEKVAEIERSIRVQWVHEDYKTYVKPVYLFQ